LNYYFQLEIKGVGLVFEGNSRWYYERTLAY